MKKKIISFLLFIPLILSTCFLSSCNKSKFKITIAEVTHSIFYAPQYAALELGYFKDEGLEVDLITTPGVMRNVS